jgi:hypothetical protein
MTKPVAVVRSRVIGDSRHTIRFDENIHLVLFPSMPAVALVLSLQCSGL